MDDLARLQKNIGVAFKDTNLLICALTHRSYLNENPKVKFSNERLEFLGDSVLQVLTSTELYRRFPDLAEGGLTNLRSALVRTKSLSEIAKKLDLGRYLLMSKGEEKGGGRENQSLLANAFEAVLGAIYLDQGLPSCKAILEKWLFSQIETLRKSDKIFDYKSLLQEKVQEEMRVSPTYKVIDEVGPDHDKTFTVAVRIGEREMATGHGHSKQEAEQEAARQALLLLEKRQLIK